MKVDCRPRAPVAVEIDGQIADLIQQGGEQALAKRLQHDLGDLLHELGIPGTPDVCVGRGGPGRAVRLRVHGILLPYSPSLMERVWLAMTAGRAGALPRPQARPSASGCPDSWLSDYASSLASDHEPDWRPLVEYIGRLALQVIRMRPGCLIGPDQVAAYLCADGPGPDLSSRSDSLGLLAHVLSSLVDLGVSLRDRPAVLRAIEAEGASTILASDPDEALEDAFAQLRTQRLEILVHPADLHAMFPMRPITSARSVYDPELGFESATLFSMLEDEHFKVTGVRLPDLVWMPAPTIRPGMLALKINDVICLPVPAFDPVDESIDAQDLVAAPATASAGQTVTSAADGKGTTVPDHANALGLPIEVDADLLTQAWSTVAMLARRDIRPMIDSMLSVEDVEYVLAHLEPDLPRLVQAVTAHVSLGDLTRVLRDLVRESVPIVDMRTILERLVDFDEIAVSSPDLVVFDDRFAVVEGTPSTSLPRWCKYREHVRRGLKVHLSGAYDSEDRAVSAIELAPDIEARIGTTPSNGSARSAATGLSDLEVETLRNRVWSLLASLPTGSRLPVLLTTYARAAVRDLIAPEIPFLTVLARDELLPDVEIRSVGRIGLS